MTIKRAATKRRTIRPGRYYGRYRPDRVEKLGPGDEDHARAGNRKKPAAPARIDLEIVTPAFNRA